MSLPPRERGLKPGGAVTAKLAVWSLPPRERGLKRYLAVHPENEMVSLPPRERGLKQLNYHDDCNFYSRSHHGSVD